MAGGQVDGVHEMRVCHDPDCELHVRDHEDVDQAEAIRIARMVKDRDGSKWHDVDQRLARAVLRMAGV